jgi:hypothetical protein
MCAGFSAWAFKALSGTLSVLVQLLGRVLWQAILPFLLNRLGGWLLLVQAVPCRPVAARSLLTVLLGLPVLALLPPVPDLLFDRFPPVNLSVLQLLLLFLLQLCWRAPAVCVPFCRACTRPVR